MVKKPMHSGGRFKGICHRSILDKHIGQAELLHMLFFMFYVLFLGG
jgi:hypothetical protein